MKRRLISIVVLFLITSNAVLAKTIEHQKKEQGIVSYLRERVIQNWVPLSAVVVGAITYIYLRRGNGPIVHAAVPVGINQLRDLRNQYFAAQPHVQHQVHPKTRIAPVAKQLEMERVSTDTLESKKASLALFQADACKLLECKRGLAAAAEVALAQQDEEVVEDAAITVRLVEKQALASREKVVLHFLNEFPQLDGAIEEAVTLECFWELLENGGWLFDALTRLQFNIAMNHLLKLRGEGRAIALKNLASALRITRDLEVKFTIAAFPGRFQKLKAIFEMLKHLEQDEVRVLAPALTEALGQVRRFSEEHAHAIDEMRAQLRVLIE